jgi:putative transposase
LLLAVTVTAASQDDGREAPDVLGQLPQSWFPRLRLVWADHKYHNHTLYGWMDEYAHYELEIVRRPEGAKGFVLLPKRWVVERTFAWLKRCRRLTVDRERTVLSSEAMIHVAMIHLMLNRLCPADNEAEFHYRKTA